MTPPPISCPACNKSGQTLEVCTRCGCELTASQTVVRAACRALGEGVAALEDADWPTAFTWATHAWKLHQSGSAARLAFLAAVGQRDPRQILQWHRRALRAGTAEE